MVHSPTDHSLIDFNNLPSADQYYIAFSGGMDSTALLHELVSNPDVKSKLTAIHVNHNIHSQSAHWAEHCQHVCDQYQLQLITVSVLLKDHSENTARIARQRVFHQYLTDKDCLLTAHHTDDHIETTLFRLLRGTGLNGLTGMAESKKIDHYNVYRPLFHLSKSQIHNYVSHHDLKYITDPSNQDNKYSRNHLRNDVIPLLQKYESNATRNIKLTAGNLANSLLLINHMIGSENPLKIRNYLNKEMLSTALYHWLNAKQLVVPGHKSLNQFASDCFTAANDKNPKLDFNQFCLIRWRDGIYLINQLGSIHPQDLALRLVNNQELKLPGKHGKLILSSAIDSSIDVIIKFNQTHESIRVAGNTIRKKIKKLFQEHNIPPWERDLIPYVYINGHLLAVGDNILSAEFKNILNQYNAEFHWLSSQVLL